MSHLASVKRSSSTLKYDVSIRFNEKDDNVVLESQMTDVDAKVVQKLY